MRGSRVLGRRFRRSSVAAADTTAPVITVGPTVTANTTGTSVTITWTTNEASTSRVDYGTTASYGSNVEDLTLVTSHSVNLTGLTTDTLYHYQVTSKDAANNQVQSSDATFTTFDNKVYVASGWLTVTNWYGSAATTYNPTPGGIAILMRLTGTPSGNAGVAARGNNGISQGFGMMVNSSSQAFFRASDGTARQSGSATLTTNTLYGLVGLIRGTTVEVYTSAGVAGAGYSTFGTYVPGTRTVTIGAFDAGANPCTVAEIAGVVFFSGTPSAGNIATWIADCQTNRDVGAMPGATTDLLYSVRQAMKDLSSDNPWVASSGGSAPYDLTRNGSVTITAIANASQVWG